MKQLITTVLAGILLIILNPSQGNSQYNIDYGFRLGAANYLGEMGGDADSRKPFLFDLKLSQTRWAGGGFFRYKLTNMFSANGGVNYLRIQGSDKLSSNLGRVGRNLNFKNDIIEVYARGEIYPYILSFNDIGGTGRYRFNLKVFLFAGVAGVYHNPKGQLGSNWYALRPLTTEGKKYSPFTVAIPMGGGIHLTYRRIHRFGMEMNYRTTFTDYLDDVSDTYVDPSLLPSQLAVDLANKTLEVPKEDRPQESNYYPGLKRGDPTHNDAYFFASFTYSYVLKGRNSFYRQNYGWLTPKRRSKRRKVRAKF